MKNSAVLLCLLIICMFSGCANPTQAEKVLNNEPGVKTSVALDVASSTLTEIPFDVDQDIVGDPPEGEFSVYEAQKLLADSVSAKEDPVFWKTPALFYLYLGIEELDGKDYYQIDLCMRQENNEEPKTLRTYLAGGDGTLLQKSGDENWLDLSANPKAYEAAWWGEYKSDVGAFDVSNYSGTSFRFLFRTIDGVEFEGTAAVDPSNLFSALYMDLVFVLSNDVQTVTVAQHGNQPDKAERTPFIGLYQRD